MNARTIKRGAERINDSTFFQLTARAAMVICALAMPVATTIMWNTYLAIDALKLSNAALVILVAEARTDRTEDRAEYERRFAELRDTDLNLWRAIRSADRMGR